jgi:tRNA threonylcarbamoyladenosine biosynthesis protein TsaE
MALTLSRTSAGELGAHLNDEAATLELGARLAVVLRDGLKIYLSGELGAGKTTLVRGLLRALGYRGRVKSPTFTLVELYHLSRLDLYHFDFYRFKDPREWTDAGLREAFGTGAVCIVEWPEKAAGQLPPPDLRVCLEHAQTGREVRLAPDSDEGRQCLEQLIG